MKGQAAARRIPPPARFLKGQAAVEYLTTYGWAILALVIVLGLLVSTGVFSPSYLVSEECSFGNNLKCDVAFFNQAGATHMNIRFFNGFPYKVMIKDLELQGSDGTALTGFANDVELESGASYTYEAEVVGPQVPVETLKRFTGNLTYVSCAPELGPSCSTVGHTLSGRVSARVIAE
ncbi:MAG: hypothetical protein AB1295_01025 [Candidatus Micrarchaeota archaeon]